ncbi:MAG TPA: glycerol-3-phosphate dehydrogenase/oxidase [bacterium]|nr:glycerol-3-phosphate dehydrogenase/oxidase [bacterium]
MGAPPSDREEAWQALRRGCDVLVIGGGITGAGVALDAALRGYSVALVDRADFASGTSSRSTKLVHGGLRYLPQLQVGLVREALVERERLRRLAPDLVRPLSFLVPLYRRTRRPLGLDLPAPLRPLAPLGVELGLRAYDWLSGTDLRHRRLSAAEARSHLPTLRLEGLRTAFLYGDAQTDDAALTYAVLEAARRSGAITLNYAEVTAIAASPPEAVVVDRAGETAGPPRAVRMPVRHIVNAAGVWAAEVAALAGPPPFRIERSKGVHLVLDAGELLRDTALVIPETDDGRLAFAVPWRGRILLGTTDDVWTAPDVRPQAREARYLLDHLNRYLVQPIGREAVIAGYAGLRPLVRRGTARTAALSRSHEVVEHPGPLVSVIGGKLTTYRRMAEDTVDVLVRRDGRRAACATASHPLPVSAAADRLAAAEPALAAPLAPGITARPADVIAAVREAQCLRLADFMFHRSAIGVLDRDHGAGCVERVAALMARELGWTEERTALEIEAYRRRVAAEMAFLEEL